MNLCEAEEGLFSYCVFKHLWRINFYDNPALPLTFNTHDGNCEWFAGFQRKSNHSDSTSEKLLCAENEPNVEHQDIYMEVRLNDSTGKYPKGLKSRKIDIHICNANNENELHDSVNNEVYIDSSSNIAMIPFAPEEARKIYEFAAPLGYLNVALKIFDISNITCETNRLSDDFETLLKLGENGNFKHLVDEKEFIVHDGAHAGRSDDFSAKYSEQIRECVKVSKMRVEVMTEFLRYVYTRKVNITEDIAVDLLTAADRYDIIGLKRLCEKKLSLS